MKRLLLALLIVGCTTAPKGPHTVGKAEVLDGNDDLIIHFHGSPEVAFQAAHGRTMAVINLGVGSAAYEQPFSDPEAFPQLLASLGRPFKHVYLSGFSAGYGAVRAILRLHPDKVDGVLLLDGLHTDYPFNETKMEPFLAFARRAAAGEKTMVITHSQIFPGTYASTTECADYIIIKLDLARTQSCRYGPNQMQQVSEVRKGRLTILGFNGKTGEDHMKHLRGMPEFIRYLR